MTYLGGKTLRLPWDLTPLEAFARWPRERAVVFMHSGRLHPRWGRYSVLAEPRGAYRFEGAEPGEGRSVWVGEDEPGVSWSHEPFADLSALFEDKGSMWVGHLSYDLGRWIERLPSEAKRDRDWPVAQMHRCPGWLVYDGLERAWFAGGRWRERGLPDLPRMERQAGRFEAGQPVSVMSPEGYEQMVARGKEYIGAGDVFQVNLSQRFTGPFEGETRPLFEALAVGSPAWYGAYMELLGGEGEPARALASTSPELFLEMRPGGSVTSRPIKGTRPAAADPGELEASEKDAAELHMIVDLMRNDIGRVCEYGSVQVVQPRTIESHPKVHHGVATIAGRLKAGQGLTDLLRATMPGGSVTGAPKVRAMQIIDELEPVRRGPYCGAVGYVHGGVARFNIAIRTMLLEQGAGTGRVDFSVGGGIVADSDPAAEYQETLDKAAAIMQALRRDELGAQSQA